MKTYSSNYFVTTSGCYVICVSAFVFVYVSGRAFGRASISICIRLSISPCVCVCVHVCELIGTSILYQVAYLPELTDFMHDPMIYCG